MAVTILITILALQSPQPSSTPVTIEEYLALKRPTEVLVSPDGSMLAFTVREADVEANDYVSRLYLWDADGGARIVETGGTDIRQPRWSDDGALLAFLAGGARGNPSQWQLYTMEPRSAAVTQLGEFPGGVLEYGWAPDYSIYVLTPNLAGGEREFWRIDVSDGGSEYAWGGDPGIRDMSVSPDGNWIVFATNGTGALEDYLNYDLLLLDLEAKRTRELTSRPGSETSPRWSPDSRTVVFRAPNNPRYPYSQSDLYSVAVSGGALTNLTESFDRTVVDHVWPAEGNLMFTAAIGTYTQLFVANADGAIVQIAGGEYCIGPFDVASAGSQVFAVRESGTEVAEIWQIAAGSPRRLTNINAQARRWRLGRQQVITWVAPDGQAIEGLLIYPADYVEGRRYPLLVNPAGGPLSRVRDVINQPAGYQLLAARGYAILAPNFRGSSGYGEDFATAPRTDLAGGDLVDLLAGVDRVIELGVADPERTGIYGGAAGAYANYMVSWAITQTPRFNAAIAIFGPTAPFGIEPAIDMPPPEHALLVANYLDLLERQRSPIEFIANVQTPLLIIGGDFESMVSRSQRLYRALNELGRDVEEVGIDRDWASLSAPRDYSELFFRQLRWFDKYLKFGGANLFDFFLVDEWGPGPGGWQLRVVRAEPRTEISDLTPDAGRRYLEIELAIRPDETAVRAGELQGLELHPAEAVSLVGPDSTAQVLAGTLTDVFGRETLITGPPSGISIPAGHTTPSSISLRLVFEIPNDAAEYRLRIIGFVPVRIWVAERE
jgi:dipeptidyl aminopeptidase/acylaminoacyl peptidase